jgi:hypothetical protein
LVFTASARLRQKGYRQVAGSSVPLMFYVQA